MISNRDFKGWRIVPFPSPHRDNIERGYENDYLCVYIYV